MASRPVNVNDILSGHVGLDLECLDRIYLNLYVRHEAPFYRVGGRAHLRPVAAGGLKLGAA